MLLYLKVPKVLEYCLPGVDTYLAQAQDRVFGVSESPIQKSVSKTERNYFC